MKCGLALSALAAAAVMLAAQDHLRLNVSASMPLGFWWVDTTPSFRTGDAVTVCLPNAVATMARSRGYVGSGTCSGDAEPLLKTVLALEGDTVTVTPSGLAVNGRPVHGSASLVTDTAGCPITAVPPGRYVVQPGTLWILATRDRRSFDSRYFGPLPLAVVQGAARPLLIWEP
ncbi:conjugative transfer signal peptidase TraF (plasmid) [Skermanella sp. TT6]|uniref:Conjugative transfer signal peptidase TraF n=1 Tax=Skermanella cutis TaxID=2775420 RepID=A0ABX7BFP7_9PROT|nr:conjugative transfer signal peptidase TraF [Skermanella sp. TT6]QQP93222.1 conjugative transfer signal peptidase TraF [Skermanella sp. TT6]